MRYGHWLIPVVLILPLLAAGPALAGDDGNWMIRGRVIYVAPDASGSGDLGDAGVDVDNNFTAEVDFSYFFNDNLAVEAIVATTSHEVTIEGGSLGSASLLPPTVLLQYHFRPDGGFRPYVGVGLNYTIFYDQTGYLASSEFDDLDNSFGLAGQIGADIPLANGMFFNLDLKYIQVDTDVVFKGDKIGTLDIDPWIFGVGFGWRF